MYKPSILSTAVLSTLAMTPFALNLNQLDATLDTTRDLATTEAPAEEEMPVPEQPGLGLLIEEPDLAVLIDQAIDTVAPPTPDAAESDSDSDSEDGDCGCECVDPCAVNTNLPDGVWTDPQLEMVGEGIVEALEPEVIDLALELDLSAEDLQSMEADILLPALEKALADLEAAHPHLKGLLPEVPSNLEETVNAVKEAMNYEKTVDEDGVTTHSVVTGNGWLDSYEAYEQFGHLQQVNPVAIFFASEGDKEACEVFTERWELLQKNNPGIVAVQIDIDVNADAAKDQGVNQVPYFKLWYQNEPRYDGDGTNWAEFKTQVTATVAEAKASASIVEEIINEEQEIKITEELAGEIASKFGYDLDEEEAKQNDLE